MNAKKAMLPTPPFRHPSKEGSSCHWTFFSPLHWRGGAKRRGGHLNKILDFSEAASDSEPPLTFDAGLAHSCTVFDAIGDNSAYHPVANL